MTTKLKFEVGNEVVVTDIGVSSNPKIICGMKGKVLFVDAVGVLVEFETYIGGHDGGGRGEGGKCYWVSYQSIELNNQEDDKMEARKGFTIGDEVVVVGAVHDSNKITVGMKGTILNYYKYNTTSVGVEFSKNVGGHVLDGEAKDGYGWYIDADSLEKVKQVATESNKEEFTVTVEGKRTTVTLADGSVGTSKPIDTDEYSLEKGILIAKEKAHLESKQRECDSIIAEAEEISGQMSELEGQLVEKAKSFIELQLEMAHHQAEVTRIGG